MKKIISLILAVIMLLSAVPMQSLAADLTLEKVEFSNNVPVSNQDIQNKVSYYGNVDESTRVHLQSINYDEYYTDYKLYFSNGKVCDTADYYLIYPAGIINVYFYPEVSPLECQRAIDEGLPYVNVYLTVTIEKIFGAQEVYEFVLQQSIVEGIVKDIRLVDSMPENYDDEQPSVEFIGKTFEIEYFDGRVETQKIVADEDFVSPYLKNDFVYFDVEIEEEVNEETGEEKFFKTVRIDYLDIKKVFYKEEAVLIYSDVEILDYKFDGKGGVTQLTYLVTYKDGRTLERTCSFKKGVGANCDAVIDVIDGNEVVLQIYVESLGGDEFQMFLGVGYYEWSIGDAVYGDADKCCKCPCHGDGLKYIFGLLLLRIWTLFRINQECRCNTSHWY